MNILIWKPRWGYISVVCDIPFKLHLTMQRHHSRTKLFFFYFKLKHNVFIRFNRKTTIIGSMCIVTEKVRHKTNKNVAKILALCIILISSHLILMTVVFPKCQLYKNSSLCGFFVVTIEFFVINSFFCFLRN